MEKSKVEKEEVELILDNIESYRNELLIINNSIIGDPEIESAIIDIRFSLRDLSLVICRKYIKQLKRKLEEKEVELIGGLNGRNEYNIQIKERHVSPEQKIAAAAGKALADKIG